VSRVALAEVKANNRAADAKFSTLNQGRMIEKVQIVPRADSQHGLQEHPVTKLWAKKKDQHHNADYQRSLYNSAEYRDAGDG